MKLSSQFTMAGLTARVMAVTMLEERVYTRTPGRIEARVRRR
jgi:hypothetical protein